MDIKPERVAHQFFGYPDSDLIELLDAENDNSEGLKEEHLLELITHITRKKESIWSLRGILHQMMQRKGEPVSSFVARLHDQTWLCGYNMTCRAHGCTHSNDFTDTIIMGKLVQGLIDHKIK